jgi:hypothetical protein
LTVARGGKPVGNLCADVLTALGVQHPYTGSYGLARNA